MEAFYATTFWVSCSFLALWAEVSVLEKQKEGVCIRGEGEVLEQLLLLLTEQPSQEPGTSSSFSQSPAPSPSCLWLLPQVVSIFSCDLLPAPAGRPGSLVPSSPGQMPHAFAECWDLTRFGNDVWRVK